MLQTYHTKTRSIIYTTEPRINIFITRFLVRPRVHELAAQYCCMFATCYTALGFLIEYFQYYTIQPIKIRELNTLALRPFLIFNSING
jgi:hypothetical protein